MPESVEASPKAASHLPSTHHTYGEWAGAGRRHAIFVFAAADAAAAAVHLLWGHFGLAAGDLSTTGRAYLVVALASLATLLSLTVAVPALLATWPRQTRRLSLLLAPAGALILHVFIASDRLVFLVLGTHVNGPVLAVAMTPGGLGAMGAANEEWLALGALICAGALVAGAAQLGIVWRLRHSVTRWAAAPRALLLTTICLFAIERVAYAAGPALGWREPIRAAAAMPLADLERSLDMRLGAERLRYPRAPLVWRDVDARPNLVFIVVESWRPDVLNPENMPAVWRWSRDATRFLNHRSGGNWSQAGGISLFYGLHAAYSDALDDARREPILFERARALGYDLRAIVSRATRFPRYTYSVFAGMPAGSVEDDLPGADSAQKDRALIARVRTFLAGRTPGRPYLLALFVDATHLPYAFGPESTRYRPYTERLYYTEMTKPSPREPIFNRYRNAVADVDTTVGSVLEAIDGAGLGETIVVLTGDHGQEFYEHGALGHNISMNGEQTAVPLVVRMPGLPPGDVATRTLHVDVAPTLLRHLGLLNPPADYSQGRVLASDARPRTTLMCGMVECAIQDPDGRTTVFRPAAPLHPLRVFDSSWRPLPATLASPAIPAARAELRAFLQ